MKLTARSPRSRATLLAFLRTDALIPRVIEPCELRLDISGTRGLWYSCSGLSLDASPSTFALRFNVSPEIEACSPPRENSFGLIGHLNSSLSELRT